MRNATHGTTAVRWFRTSRATWDIFTKETLRPRYAGVEISMAIGRLTWICAASRNRYAVGSGRDVTQARSHRHELASFMTKIDCAGSWLNRAWHQRFRISAFGSPFQDPPCSAQGANALLAGCTSGLLFWAPAVALCPGRRIAIITFCSPSGRADWRRKRPGFRYPL